MQTRRKFRDCFRSEMLMPAFGHGSGRLTVRRLVRPANASRDSATGLSGGPGNS